MDAYFLDLAELAMTITALRFARDSIPGTNYDIRDYYIKLTIKLETLYMERGGSLKELQ